VGALLNNFLFLFVSIPLMEKRQLENKTGVSGVYEEYGEINCLE
jgi:hypothetical protein